MTLTLQRLCITFSFCSKVKVKETHVGQRSLGCNNWILQLKSTYVIMMKLTFQLELRESDVSPDDSAAFRPFKFFFLKMY